MNIKTPHWAQLICQEKLGVVVAEDGAKDPVTAQVETHPTGQVRLVLVVGVFIANFSLYPDVDAALAFAVAYVEENTTTAIAQPKLFEPEPLAATI